MLLTYTSFSNPGSGSVQTGGGTSGVSDGTGSFGTGGTGGMDPTGGPADAEPAPTFAPASGSGFTGPTSGVFAYTAGIGVPISTANLVFAHQNSAAVIAVTAITAITGTLGINAPTTSTGNVVGDPFNFAGTPNSTGTVQFDVTLNDGTISKTWRIEFTIVNQVAPQITSTAPTTGTVGINWTYNIAATGAPSPTLTVAGEPAWMTLTGNVLSGTPTAPGTFGPITITAANGVNPDATQVFTVVVVQPPQITSTAITTAIVNQLYSYTITVTGDPAPTLSVAGNPGWLTLTGNVLSGTPTAVGTFGPITITATNGVNPDDTQTFSIDADFPPVAPQITSSPILGVVVDTPYTYNITATGYPAPTLSVFGNPGWLTLSGNTLSGTPTALGTYGPITITAINGVNPDATQTFSINVNAGTFTPGIGGGGGGGGGGCAMAAGAPASCIALFGLLAYAARRRRQK